MIQLRTQTPSSNYRLNEEINRLSPNLISLVGGHTAHSLVPTDGQSVIEQIAAARKSHENKDKQFQAF